MFKKINKKISRELSEKITQDEGFLRVITEIEEKAKTKDYEFDMIITTDDLDRQGERIDTTGMSLKNYRKHPVVLLGHEHGELPVGMSPTLIRKNQDGGKALRAKGYFASIEANPKAQQVKKLYDEGIMNTASVGILVNEIQIQNEDGEVKATIQRKELKDNRYLVRTKGGEKLDREKLKEDGMLTKDEEIGDEKEIVVITKSELLEWSFVTVPANANATAVREMGFSVTELTKNKILYKEENIREKSPACRKENETEEECRQRKIPEIISEGYDEDQAVAMAYSMCQTPCSEKQDDSEDPDSGKPKEVQEVGRIMNDLNNKVNDAVIQASRKVIKQMEAALENGDKQMVEDLLKTLKDNKEKFTPGAGSVKGRQESGYKHKRSNDKEGNGEEEYNEYSEIRALLKTLNNATSDALAKYNAKKRGQDNK